jgi:hypothetical protein
MDKMKPKRDNTNPACHPEPQFTELAGRMSLRTNTERRTVTFSSIVIRSFNGLPRRVDRGRKLKKDFQTIHPSEKWRSSRLEPRINGTYVYLPPFQIGSFAALGH